MQVALAFGISLVLLLVAQRWATHLLILALYKLTGSVRVGMTIYALLIFPGTVLHEFAHWVAATILGVRATLPHLLPGGVDERGRMVLGYVRMQRTDPVRHSIIGVAPLVAGSAVVAVVASQVFALPVPTLTQSGMAGLRQLLDALPLVFEVADVWLYLYLLFAVANAMLPSHSDRDAWGTVALFAVVIGVLVLFFVGVPDLPSNLSAVGLDGLSWLTFAFILTALLDTAVVVVLLPVNWLLRLLR